MSDDADAIKGAPNGTTIKAALGKHGGDRRSDKVKESNQSDKVKESNQGSNHNLDQPSDPIGRGRDYILARLDRDQPELAEKVRAGGDRDADHLVFAEQERPRRKRVHLKVIDPTEPAWVPDGKMPKTRAECPDTSRVMCGAWQCRFWLGGRVDAGDRAGRPGLTRVPRDPVTGLTYSVQGDIGEEIAGTTIVPRWLDERGEFRFIPTCALDEIERRGKMSNEEIGALIGRHRTLAERVIKNAARALIAKGGTIQGLRVLADPEARELEEPSLVRSRERVRGVR